MAFPTGYTKYQEVTVDFTKVSADQTDFPIYIDLANLSKAGADIFDTCRTDGGDIRATKTDGTTLIPIQIVAIDTTAKTGEIHVKFSGTLSSSTNTVIRIWYNGTDTALARSDANGSDNVWNSNYKGVWHLQENPAGTSPQMDDSTVNAKDGTTTNMVAGDSVAVKIAKGLDFAGDDHVDFGDCMDEVSTGVSTIEFWAGGLATNTFLFRKASAASGGFQILLRGDDKLYFEYTNAAGTDFFASAISTSTYADATIRHFVATFDGLAQGIQMYVNSSATGADVYSSVGSIATGNTNAFTMSSSGGSFLGQLDEVRVSNISRPASYITTTYNNQNSPSTFYSTGNEVVTSVSVTVSGTVQTATFSVPTYTASISVAISASVFSATFSVPSYVVNPLNVTILPSVLASLFSIPTYEVEGDFWSEKYSGVTHAWSDKFGALSKVWNNKY